MTKHDDFSYSAGGFRGLSRETAQEVANYAIGRYVAAQKRRLAIASNTYRAALAAGKTHKQAIRLARKDAPDFTA